MSDKANIGRGAIQYADLTDFMLMLDLQLGGGVIDAVNEGQRPARPAGSDPLAVS